MVVLQKSARNGYLVYWLWMKSQKSPTYMNRVTSTPCVDRAVQAADS